MYAIHAITRLALDLADTPPAQPPSEPEPLRRTVRSILIAGDQTGQPGRPTPGSIGSLDVVEEHIRARFGPAYATIERLHRRPTRQHVTQALRELAKRGHPDDLYLIMYAGHGIGASHTRPAQSWSLSEGEAFSDLDLAIALRALPAGADAVVMNNCCYGEGLFEVGRHDQRSVAEQRADTPMVCISAAGECELVQLSKLGDLAGHTVAAAAAGHSYRQLAKTFETHAVAGGAFRVDARPAERLDDAVLSPVLGRRRMTLHHRPLTAARGGGKLP